MFLESSYAYPYDTVACQAAKGVNSSHGALADLLESIERFVRPLGIYTQVPHTTALDEVLVRILMELLSIFALATKVLEQGQSGEPTLVGIYPDSMARSNL